MKITGLSLVDPLLHPPAARMWLYAWIAEVRLASWRKATDVMAQFPRATQQGQNQFYFHTPDPNLVVAIVVAFQQGVVLIMRGASAGNSHGT